MKYQLIYADPPWRYNDNASRGAAERHYPTMKLADIHALDVGSLAQPNCLLAMWATFPLLTQALSTIEAWGFSYRTIGFVWAKTNKDGSLYRGMGHYTRSNAEIMLFASRGRALPRLNKGMCNTVLAPRERHSKKPDIFRNNLVDLYGDIPRIELFARQPSEGWHVWGNQVETDIQL